MKLFEIIGKPPIDSDESNDPAKTWALITDEEFDVLYDIANNGTMSKGQLKDRCAEFQEQYDSVGESRTIGALVIAAIRMYLLIHGELPEDMITAENGWFDGSSMTRFADYAERKGIDVQFAISSAKEENERRREQKAKRRTREDALVAMRAFWTANKNQLDAKQAQANRDSIIAALEGGSSPEEAFAPYSR